MIEAKDMKSLEITTSSTDIIIGFIIHIIIITLIVLFIKFIIKKIKE
jgi:hypothetical protein